MGGDDITILFKREVAGVEQVKLDRKYNPIRGGLVSIWRAIIFLYKEHCIIANAFKEQSISSVNGQCMNERTTCARLTRDVAASHS
jgi:hypothetical protein